MGLAAAAALLAGCPPKPLPPPMTLSQVIAQVNRNNDLLPWLKGSIRTIGGEVVDAQGKRQNLDMLGLNGLLIYAQPDHLFLDLSKAGDSYCQLGSNEALYWMWIAPPRGEKKCWVGSSAQWSPAVGGGIIPIHPRQLARLLAIDSIPLDLRARPYPVLRVSEPACRANIVQFLGTNGRGLVLERELWIDRDTNRPRTVRLFNGEGQVIMESTLSDWRAASQSDGQKASGPAGLFPHDVEIRWIVLKPADGGVVQGLGPRLHLQFAGVTVDEDFSPAKNPGVYQFRCPPDVKRVPLDDVATSQAVKGETD